MARSINKSESRTLLRSLPQKDWVCSEGCFIFGVCGGGGGGQCYGPHCLGYQKLGGVTENRVFSGLGFLVQRRPFKLSCSKTTVLLPLLDFRPLGSCSGP